MFIAKSLVIPCVNDKVKLSETWSRSVKKKTTNRREHKVCTKITETISVLFANSLSTLWFFFLVLLKQRSFKYVLYINEAKLSRNSIKTVSLKSEDEEAM